MASPRGTRTPSPRNPEDRSLKPSSRSNSTFWSRQWSMVVGVLLLVVAAIWLGWLVVHRETPVSLSLLTIPGLPPLNTPIGQPSPLVAAGVTLGRPSQTPALNQQQALLLAGQLEPDAAANAKQTSSEYVLLNYTNTSSSTSRSNLRNVPVWLVQYSQIPLASDQSVDPNAPAHATYDLYVFLDANSGKELLKISA